MIRRRRKESCFQFLQCKTATFLQHNFYRFVSSLIDFIIKLWAQRKYLSIHNVHAVLRAACVCVCVVSPQDAFCLFATGTVRCQSKCVSECMWLRAKEWRARAQAIELANGLRRTYVVHARLSTSISINFYYPDHETSLHRFNFLILLFIQFINDKTYTPIESQSQLQFVLCNTNVGMRIFRTIAGINKIVN